MILLPDWRMKFYLLVIAYSERVAKYELVSLLTGGWSGEGVWGSPSRDDISDPLFS